MLDHGIGAQGPAPPPWGGHGLLPGRPGQYQLPRHVHDNEERGVIVQGIGGQDDPCAVGKDVVGVEDEAEGWLVLDLPPKMPLCSQKCFVRVRITLVALL